jgi:K+-sensing histidine kinase KdpD
MKSGIERIFVSLDAVSENATAIDTAAHLAAHWKAHLHGVFVEDEDLLNLAGLPFARQITLHSGAEPLTAEEVERHLHAAAETARRALTAAANKSHIAKLSPIKPGGGQLPASAILLRFTCLAAGFTSVVLPTPPQREAAY